MTESLQGGVDHEFTRRVPGRSPRQFRAQRRLRERVVWLAVRPRHGLRISGSQSNCWYSTVKVFELIDVLSECGPGFGVGWVLGTISATGCHAV